MSPFEITDRTRVRRIHELASYDRDVVHAILDAGLISHLGYVIDGEPYVTPTSHWRQGDFVYWHGSSASRMIKAQKSGIPVCLSASHLDGIVLARSGYNTSYNYRSVVVYGDAELVVDEEAKLTALRDFMERLAPGRWDTLRPPTVQEMKATAVMRMEIREAAAKVNNGPPEDEEGDLDAPVWAGVLPLRVEAGAPEPDMGVLADMEEPDYLHRSPVR